eukprot:m.38664 g.38664  ORF g.38664 m.38664 type:complete len:385 (+) comp12606_c0_seq4:192-1346(+)
MVFCMRILLLRAIVSALLLSAILGQDVSQNSTSRLASLPPAIIGLGAQKAGSTTLFAYLRELKWMDTALSKELHFFDKLVTQPIQPQSNRALQVYKNYARKWPRANRKLTCQGGSGCNMSTGYSMETTECTPIYLSDRRVATQIRNVLPHADSVKFLVILRDPVERANSGYWQANPNSMTVKWATELALKEVDVLNQVYNTTLSLHRAKLRGRQILNHDGCATGWEQYKLLDAELQAKKIDKRWFSNTLKTLPGSRVFGSSGRFPAREGHVYRGIYVDQIRNYICAGFKPEQFLILTNGELRDDQTGAMHRIAQFMDRPVNLKHARKVESGMVRYSRPHGHFSDGTIATLQAFYKPYNQDLVRLLLENRFNVNPHYILKEFEKY